LGLRRCGPCKREFTVKVGTVFEDSKIKLNRWLQAAHLMACSKKGISAHQLHRTLKVTYKTACSWNAMRTAVSQVGARTHRPLRPGARLIVVACKEMSIGHSGVHAEKH
jgi:hypothetical protein